MSVFEEFGNMNDSPGRGAAGGIVAVGFVAGFKVGFYADEGGEVGAVFLCDCELAEKMGCGLGGLADAEDLECWWEDFVWFCGEPGSGVFGGFAWIGRGL